MEVTNLEQYAEAIRGSCVVKFTATWCGPCKRVAPVFDKLAERYADYDVRFLTVDIDKADAITDMENISSIPCFLIYHEGKAIPGLRIVGADVARLQDNIEALCDGLIGAPTPRITMAVDDDIDVDGESSDGKEETTITTPRLEDADSSLDSSGNSISEVSDSTEESSEESVDGEVDRILTPRMDLAISSDSEVSESSSNDEERHNEDGNND